MKKNKRTLTPRLRFPEFWDKPGWDDTVLGNVLTEHGEKNDGVSEVHSVSVHKGVVNQIEHLGRSFAAADRSKYNLAKPHDVIYTKSPTGDFPYGIVKQNQNPYNVIVSPLYGVFSPENRHLGYILDCYFESPIRTCKYLAPITQKGAKNTIQISNATFLSKSIYLPSIPLEQQKIADCLGSLDGLIVAEGRKLEALKTHKNGLMQQLFPQPGQTQPRLRFPEFRDAGEWKKGQCSDIAHVWQGYGFPDRYQGQHIGKYPFYKVSDISAAVEHGGKLLGEAQNYIDDMELKKLKAKPVPAGTIVFAKIGEAIKKDRRALTTRPAVVDNNVAGVKAITGKMTDDFLFYLWATVSLMNFAGGVVPAVNKTAIENIPVSYPEEDEQHRIAESLSSLDGLIAAEFRTLEALRDHKRGLMQQLFPSPEEQ